MKAIVTILSFVLLFSLSACQHSEGSPTNSTQSPSTNDNISETFYGQWAVLSDKEFQADYRIPLNQLTGIEGNSITEVDVTGTNGRG